MEQVDGMRAGRGGKRAVLLVLAPVALAGCTGSTGVVPVGPDLFQLSEMRAPVLGGGAEAQRAVLDGAARFCAAAGRGVRLLDLRPDGDPRTRYWPTAFDATFQCVPPGAGAGVSRPATPPPAG